MRTSFQRDRDRIIHSKAFRRLKDKTQVFLAAQDDHYRTRMTHTMEVSQIGRTISRALGLNEDLTEAIALGHDLGHTPFGHSGEHVLAELTDGYFSHNAQSLRVVDYLEDDGKGLNLTIEVRDGILHHKISGTPITLEGKVVSYADRIAYLNHDIDDAIRAGILTEDTIPTEFTQVLGKTKSAKINTMIFDIVGNSMNKPYIAFSPELDKVTTKLRTFMFENVYCNTAAKSNEEEAKRMVRETYLHYLNNLKLLPPFYYSLLSRFEPYVVVCDYVSGMTDRYLLRKYGLDSNE